MTKDKSKSDEHKKKMVVVEEVTDSETKKETEVEDTETPKSKLVVESKQKLEHTTETADEVEKTNYLWIIVPTALLIGALVGGLITYFSGLSRLAVAEVTPTPVPTFIPQVESTPTASPSSTLKKDELKVQILNGSGVSGAANKAKTLLEGLGYKLIDTGNASVSNLVQTEIAAKDTKKEYLDSLIKDLAKSYAAVEAEKPLVTTSKYDVVITLGKK